MLSELSVDQSENFISHNFEGVKKNPFLVQRFIRFQEGSQGWWRQVMGFLLTPSKLWLIKFSDWSTLNSLNICHFSSFFIGLSLIMRRNALCKAHAWKAVKTSLDALFLLKTCRRPTASQCHLCISTSHIRLVYEAYPKILLLIHPIKWDLINKGALILEYFLLIFKLL